VLVPWTELDPKTVLRLLLRNRTHLAPWEPERGAEYFTLEGQTEVLARAATAQSAGLEHAAAGLEPASGRLIGRVALSGIERGSFQSCHLGYWVSVEYCYRGYATAAVSKNSEVAFGDLGLHRVGAAVMRTNPGSARVL
jgi:ribosomal-protein-alanine N-acetyltransferase